jgi:hypothetical protein
MPEEYQALTVMADLLPNYEVPVAYPFQSLVLNVNIVTKAHHDKMDCDICLVLAIGSFDGGELCLVETGMVLDLRPGNFIVF